jgi:glyoxylase-like metal-dependent hydrolase (beta-lactamase superfamily II)
MAGAYVRGQFGSTPANLTVVQVTDDLYVLNNSFVPGNTTVLITEEGVLLVDDKFEVDFDNIMTEVRRLTDQPIRYVINTHHHGDHSGSNAALQGTGAQVVASEAAYRNMVFASQPGRPDITFDREAYIHLGNRTIELYYFGRAHTDGDVVVRFSDHDVLAAGDMFTFGDDVPQLIDYAGGGSAKEWTRTLDAVLRLSFDRVVPGHGPVTTREELAAFRDVTLDTQNRVHDMLVNGASRDEVAAMLRNNYHWEDLQLARGLDGLLAEMQ